MLAVVRSHCGFARVPGSPSDPQGPDVQQQLDVPIRSSENGEHMSLHFFASELQLRGVDIAKQPHRDTDSGNILCWNGEVEISSPPRILSRCSQIP